MERPYIICHMVESIDGRIDCHMVDKISGDEYYTTLAALECPASIEGREGWRSMFDGIKDQSKLPTRLYLKSVEHLQGDVLWIRYSCK